MIARIEGHKDRPQGRYEVRQVSAVKASEGEWAFHRSSFPRWFTEGCNVLQPVDRHRQECLCHIGPLFFFVYGL